MSRNLLSSLLPLVAFTLTTGCVVEDAPGPDQGAPSHSVMGDRGSDQVATDGGDNEQPAPYADMDFQVRIELGAADVDQPTVGVNVDRILANIDGTWQGIAVPDGAVDVAPSTNGRWASIYEGNMNPGLLEDLDIMLGEDATLMDDGDAWDVWVNTSDRSFTVQPDVETLGDEPLVITILLDMEQDGDELLVTVSSVLVREVDEDGNAWELLDPRD